MLNSNERFFYSQNKQLSIITSSNDITNFISTSVNDKN